jgi:MFS family permease
MGSFLLTIAAVAGAAGMSLEMAASRMMLPYYGDSHVIWANLIGVILAALTVGYYLGGGLADRWPNRRLLLLLLGGAGLWTYLVPTVGSPLLSAVRAVFPKSQLGFVGGSLLGVLVLGCVPPLIIRLALADVRTAGNVTGRVYAVSTVGSMLGTFAPVLWLMPSFGVRATFTVTAVVLLVTALAAVSLPLRRSIAATGVSRAKTDSHD